MPIRSLHDLFVHALEDLLYAELIVAKTLPGMARRTGNRQLKAMFEAQHEATREHIARLKRVFHAIDEPAAPRRSHRAWAVAEEGASAAELPGGDLRDAALLSARQTAVHDQIVRYEASIAWARELGHDDAAGLLQRTLDAVRMAEELLARFAPSLSDRTAIAA